MAKKRRYGDAWKDVKVDADQLDPLFDKFISPRTSAAQPTPDRTSAESALVAKSAPVAKPASVAKSATGAKRRAEPVQTATVAESAPVERERPQTSAESAPVAVPAPVAPLVSVEASSGYTRVPNAILDGLIGRLSAAEFKVYLRLYRLVYGFEGRETCTVGYDKLAEKCGLSKRTTIDTVARLVRLGLIRQEGSGHTGPRSLRGNTYRVLLPTVVGGATSAKTATGAKTAPVAKAAPMKSSSLKEIHEKAPAAPAAAARSLSLEEKIRMKATILRALHEGEAYSQERFKRDLRLMLQADGLEPDEDLITEATERIAT